MSKKIMKNLMALAMVMFIVSPILLVAMPAQALDIGQTYAENIGLGNREPKSIIVSVVQVALGFLALLAVIIILIGGFKWMTAGGNDDKVAEARKLITAGIIGLLIILASWGIARWIINTFVNVTQ